MMTLADDSRTLTLVSGTIVSGDDARLTATVSIADSAVPISQTATIHAAIKDIIDPVLCSNSATGADWANGVVVIEFAESDTSDIEQSGLAVLELQVNDNGKTTFFCDVYLVIGSID